MRKSRFTDEQIVYALKQEELGIPIAEVCRKFGVSEQTVYRWRARFGGLGASEVRRLKELEQENKRLKGLVADPSLDKQILQEALGRKG
jgi:putative transposase